MGGEWSGWAVARRGGSGLNARGGHTTRKDDAEYDVGARFLPFDGNNAHEATPSESVASCALHKVGWGKGGRGRGGEGERKRGWVTLCYHCYNYRGGWRDYRGMVDSERRDGQPQAVLVHRGSGGGGQQEQPAAAAVGAGEGRGRAGGQGIMTMTYRNPQSWQ